MPHVLYLVHDLSDPAVRRRVAMLQAGGARVTLAGFRRAVQVTPPFEGSRPIELGHTRDGKFAQRLAAVATAALSLGSRLENIARPDVIIGRNLEMLALARRANALFGSEVPVVYECLDIHRLLLGNGPVSRAMRAAERLFARDAALLLTSSPAFVREYFGRFGQIEAPVMMLENKVFDLRLGSVVQHLAAIPSAGEPWIIGWFGALRCRKSLELLAAFAERQAGRLEIVLRGRPAYSEFPDFDGFVARSQHLRFEGPYRNPEDLAAIYGEVHLSWAIDFFEEGLNSSWLLPNRLYEGCRHGVVPVAMRGTETGRFLARRGIGLLLDDVDSLDGRLRELTPEIYSAARHKMQAEDGATWVADLSDCRALVERLATLVATPAQSGELMQAA